MKWILNIAIFLFVNTALSQDNHYSLYQFRQGSLNPALTGIHQENGEIRTLYRTQWNSISPISYITLEAEKQDDLWGFGINWNKNGAGLGSLISNQITIGSSRQVNLNANGYLRLGLQLGYFQHSLDWTAAVFESQFNSDGTISTENGEDLTLEKASSLDLNGGLYFSQKAGANTINIGLGLHHLAQRKLSLYSEGTHAIRPKKSVITSIDVPIDHEWTLTPNLLHQNQIESKETIIAVMAKKQYEQTKYASFGLGLRFHDALIIQSEFQLDNLTVSLAYDANVSKLRTLGSGFGAFEIGLKFRFKDPVDYSENVNLRMIDTDNDGIADDSDHCPEIPGELANKGCPGRADSDGDGIVDEVDLCPGIAGSSIHGGCPDSDGDGVADIDDECPTIYGALHFQGCPDSDQDGISDKYDACPVTFGLISNKGCPDNKVVQPTHNLGVYIVNEVSPSDKKSTTPLAIKPRRTNHKHSYRANEYSENQTKIDSNGEDAIPPVLESSTKKVVTSGDILDKMYVFFDKGVSIINFQDKKRLKDFINSYKLNDEVKIVLKGHTDPEGDELYNMELGYRRADAVRRYLSQFGFSDNTILTLSYGEEAPLSTHTGEVSNAKNRRVEIILVK